MWSSSINAGGRGEIQCCVVLINSLPSLGVKEGRCTSIGKINKCSSLGDIPPPPPPPFSAAGISRSSTIVTAYLMSISTLTAEEALSVVRHCRKIANPNYGFQKQLKEYEETTLADVKVSGEREFQLL